MRITSVLAAVDRFPQDEAVLHRALEIAWIHDAAMTIVHVIDFPRNLGFPAELDTLQGQAEFAARDRIKEALKRHGARIGDIEIKVVSGSPALRLIEFCKALAPGLVVMRAHQRSRISEKILGSTTDRVIAAGISPVLVVKQPAARPYGRVMVTTDGTDDARTSLHFAETLLPDAALHLVQVVQIVQPLKEAMLRSGTDQTGFRAYRNALARVARNHLTAVASFATGPVKIHVLRGDPAKSLVRASRMAKIDVITAGPGRKSLIECAFIGSVTRRLLRDADCDVLIGRPTDDAS